jgi:hypothetical protein
MSETEILGRIAAVEQLAVITFGMFVASNRVPDAKTKALHLLKFAANDLAQDKGMDADVRKEALAAWDEIASKISESIDHLKPG